MRTYAPITTDPGPDIRRANAVAIVAIAAGVTALLLSAIMAAAVGDMWPALVGSVLFVASLVFGVAASFYHTSAPMRANLEQAQREAEHQRDLERVRAEADTRVMVLTAQAQAQLAARVPDSAWTRPVRIDGGKAVFTPSVQSVSQNGLQNVVNVDGIGPVRVDLLNAIAYQWPNPSRDKIRAEGKISFANPEYGPARAALADYLFGIDNPTRSQIFMAVSAIQHGAPRPVALEAVSVTAETGLDGQKRQNGPDTDGAE